MAKIEDIPVLTNPQLIDKVIRDIQVGLKANLSWLTYAFGKAQRLVKIINGKKYFTPNVYAGKESYIEVSPTSDYGNFSFFFIDDPQEIEWQPKIQGRLNANFSLIFWFNIDRIEGAEGRNIEFVKSEILKTLNSKVWVKNGRFEISKIYELSENVYKGFSLDEIENQFLMHPFCGLRFTGNLTINESCY